MKKIFVTLLLAVTMTSLMAQTTTTTTTVTTSTTTSYNSYQGNSGGYYGMSYSPSVYRNGWEYSYVGQKIRDFIQSDDDYKMWGITTRFGYAYNYDAFMWGLSLNYQWNKICGITLGFDGYRIKNKYLYITLEDKEVSSNTFAMPLWDIRAGFNITKWFMFGGLMGKTNVNDANIHLNLREDAWFTDNADNNMMYGAFVTFVCPIYKKYASLNFDFTITSKTGFGVAIGIVGSLPVFE